MARADAWTIENGYSAGIVLMENAGGAVARVALEYYGTAKRVHVLCGPGNNGGDGYIAARILAEAGADVIVYALKEPKPGADAAEAAARYGKTTSSLADFAPAENDLVIDALFGAGLTRALDEEVATALARAAQANCRIVAVDLPSGVNGDSGQDLGGAVPADMTVTFFRKKPGHMLHPGYDLCGDLHVCDIGVREGVFDDEAPTLFENSPFLWLPSFPELRSDQHKYSRGHVAVFSGPRHASGAARLAAMAAQRAGAGAVTILGDTNALDIHAAHVTSIMLRKRVRGSGLEVLNGLKKANACVLGPGFGDPDDAQAIAVQLLTDTSSETALVLDADGITAFEDCPERLFAASGTNTSPRLVLTPHAGEFARLFPDLGGAAAMSKVDKARAATSRANAVLLLKGPDTVVASPDGRAVINGTGTPVLATAGSGDVLAGIISGLAAQGMPPFEAACGAAWIHGMAGRAHGFGAIAEDLIDAVPAVIRELLD